MRRLAALACGALLLASGAGHAQQAEPDEIDVLKRAIAVRDQVIRNLIGRMESLERTVTEMQNERQADPTPQPPEDAQSPSTAESVQAPEDATPITEDDRLVRAAFERTLIRRGGLLLPYGSFEIEPSFTYIHSSRDSIVIDGFTILPVLVVGDIFSERTRSDSFLGATTARFGLPWDSQFEIRIPYGYRLDRALSADNRERSQGEFGAGDIELALSHQLFRESGWIPDLLGSVRWKSPSGDDPFERANADKPVLGTGFHSVDFGLTAVKVFDPVVFFGGLTYTLNLPDNKPVGRIDPGDSYGFQLGLALALNLDTSINFVYDQRYTDRFELDGNDVPGSFLNTGTFTAGLSYVIRDNASIDLGVGIGLTEDSPDVEFNVALPLRFAF